ncbi:MAG: hypothetical protein WD773_04175 [Gemmatimonadales bacterium]
MRVLNRMPLIAYEFGLEPCGDPVSGEVWGLEAEHHATEERQRNDDDARALAESETRRQSVLLPRGLFNVLRLDFS